MSTKFFTNEGTNTLLQKLKGVFEHNKDIQFFDALVGYFRASGYFRLRPFLNDVPSVRILVGIDVDRVIEKYNTKGLLFQGDAKQTLVEFISEVKEDIQSSSYDHQTETGIIQFLEDVASRKIEIRAHPSRKLHAKIYIFRPVNWNEHRTGSVITGSSNLTDPGLGAGNKINYEFNVVLGDYDDVKFATDEFEKLWNEGISILPVEVEKIKSETYINASFTPYELYVKLLLEYFGKSVEFDPNSISDLPKGFLRLNYQIDAVNEGYKLLEKHNGFFLSDVVGLGKTIVGTLIAKKFFFSNGFPSYLPNTLIIVPPALKENWEETLNKFQLNNWEIITNGSLHKIKDYSKYDLVIVDEAHKFRNDTAEAYNELQKLCKTKSRRVLKDGTKADKKVILISATPLNNRPEDIANLVYLFQDSKDSTLDINLQHFFRQQIDAYNKLSSNNNIREVQDAVKTIYHEVRTKVIAPLTVRRTRSDLNEHRMYKDDLDAQNILFPEPQKPRKILYQLGDELDRLYDETMHLLAHETEGLKYFRYQAIKFLNASKKAKYKNADVASTALAKIMKTLLVKRIDSSFYAFKKSLDRFTVATGAMLTMFEKGIIIIAPKLNVTEYIVNDKAEELLDRVINLQQDDPSVEICSPDDFQPDFIKGLKKDYEILNELNKRWALINEDPKLDEFISKIQTELFDDSINKDGKLVVFSESKETTEYLLDKLKANGRTDIIAVNSGNREQYREAIRLNFDANIPEVDQQNEINIIISTEVLAEGVNLHRSNVIVNYDTPWNSTKLMQRIGRVNRIGSKATKILIYNFYPTSKVNNDIELEKRAIMKLQAFHSALGEDSEIYSPEEETQSFGLFDKSMKDEPDEKLQFLMELRRIKSESPEFFRRIKNMPLRARVGRKERKIRNTTICFIRNNRRDAFYWVREDGAIEELTFVDAAKSFKALSSEKAIPMHDNHHNHVKAALDDFNDKLTLELSSGQVVDTTQGPNELRALAYLDGFLSFTFIGELEIQKIKTAKQAIKLGRFQQLQREINALKRQNKKSLLKPVELLEAVLRIIESYPLDSLDDGDHRPTVTIKSFEKFKPEIILSESFSFIQ